MFLFNTPTSYLDHLIKEEDREEFEKINQKRCDNLVRDMFLENDSVLLSIIESKGYNLCEYNTCDLQFNKLQENEIYNEASREAKKRGLL